MKIALCTEIMYPLYGVERRVYEFARRLPDYGIDVDVFTSTPPERFPDLSMVHVSHNTITNPPKRNYAFCTAYMINVFRMLMKRDYDLIHAEGHLSLLPCSAAGLLRKKPSLATIHDLYMAQWGEMYRSIAALVGIPFEMVSCKMPFTKILTVNSSLKERMEKTLRMRNVGILHSGIDTKYIDSIGGLEKDGSILYIGRLVPQKSVDVLIRAYALLPENIRRDHKLRIIGEGGERGRLESLANNLGVSVDFSGNVEKYEDVISLLKAASLFVLPSRRESFGITMLESMYCGVPVISTRTEGPSDHVNGANGFLVNIGNEKEMAEKMESILSDTMLQKTLSRNAQSYASQHDWDNITKRVAEIYGKMLEK